MPTFNFTITPALATELNKIAQAQGFANGKEMVIAWIKRELTEERTRQAQLVASQQARAQAEADLDGLS